MTNLDEEDINQAISSFFRRNLERIRPYEFKPLEITYETTIVGQANPRRSEPPQGEVLFASESPKAKVPKVDDIEPNSGPSQEFDPPRQRDIHGSGFDQGATVVIGGTDMDVVYVEPDGTLITIELSAHSPGTYDVVVTNPDGISGTLEDGFTFNPPPIVDYVNPDTGSADGGTGVLVTGSGFVAGCDVTFGGDDATEITVNPGGLSISCKTPAHAVGPVNVRVTNPDLQTGITLNAYEYTTGDPDPTGTVYIFCNPTGLNSGQTTSIGVHACTGFDYSLIDTTFNETCTLVLTSSFGLTNIFASPNFGAGVTFVNGVAEILIQAFRDPSFGSGGFTLDFIESGTVDVVPFSTNFGVV